MPFLLRIILQRVLILAYSFLAFLGIEPEATIPTEQEARIAIEERQNSIQSFFNDNEDAGESFQEVVDDTKNILQEEINSNQNIKELKVELPKIPVETEIEINSNQNIKELKVELPKIPVETEIPITPNIQEIVKELEENVEEALIPETNSLTKKPSDVIVNIVCTRRTGNQISVSTGSGVVISSNGVIITNAHVGQFVLLEDELGKKFMDCSIYRQNIPTFGYKADILYISPNWIKENSDLINSTNPRGTGEDDYALLYITGNTNPAISVPSSFSHLNFSTKEGVEIGSDVIVAGYPGSPTNILDIASAGVLKTESVSILDVFTFNKNSIDVFTTSESNVGAKGASGGGVIEGTSLVGIIVTTDSNSGNGKINALTTSYINRDLISETGENISYYLKGGFDVIAKNFSRDYGEDLADLLKEEF